MSDTNHGNQENVAFAHTTEAGGHEGAVTLKNCQSADTSKDSFIQEMKIRNDELATFFSRSQI